MFDTLPRSLLVQSHRSHVAKVLTLCYETVSDTVLL